jgi:transcription elongation factor GreB
MSKAFTTETDVESEPPRRHDLVVPPGTRNYVTPTGAQQLRDELDQLVKTARPAALRATADGGPRRDLVEIEQRIADLTEYLGTAEVVDPSTQDRDRVRFGATVTLRDDAGQEEHYRIVGVGEADPRQGLVSYLSPVARALLGTEIGDEVMVRGARHEITAIAYP